MPTDRLERIAVVGASLAGLEAAGELRRAGFTGEIVVHGAEVHAPYDRPPLSKELLAGTFEVAQVVLPLGPAEDAEWRLGAPVTGLDARRRTIEVGGEVERYDGIVIATGASAIRPRFASEREEDLAGVHVVRTLDDCLGLAADLHASPQRVLVVGGGFIGAEVASTARGLRIDVTVVEALAAPMQRALGHEVGTRLGALIRDHGVDLRLGTTLLELHGHGRVERAELSDGTSLPVDVVVLAVGVQPTTAWLEGSGLTLENGVVCDRSCVAAPGIVAAGDLAVWPNERFGELRRVEHWDNAIRQGRHAARSLLAGDDPAARSPYTPVPWVWSDQFGSKLQVIGSPVQHDELHWVDDPSTSGKWIGLYRRGDRLVAAVALNSAPGIVKARRLLDQSSSWSAALSAFDRSPAHLSAERQLT